MRGTWNSKRRHACGTRFNEFEKWDLGSATAWLGSPIEPSIANGLRLEYRSPPFSETSENAGRLAQGTKGSECCPQVAARDYKNRGRDLRRRHWI